MRLTPRHRRAAFAACFGLSLSLGAGSAQTTPATPTTTPPATSAPAAGAASAATSKTASAVAIAISKTVKGQLVSCPSKLKVSPQAVCLYTKSASASARSLIRGTLGNLAAGDWKTSGQSGSLLVKDSAGGNIAAYVLLAPLGTQESLVVVDAVTPQPAAAAAKPIAPNGVVKGQPYLLGSDLAGVVNVIGLGAGKYRLNVAGETALTITAGSKTAQRAGGNVDLPLAPLSDGKNLIFPVSGLRALGCTVADAAGGITITCGPDSVGVKPIVF